MPGPSQGSFSNAPEGLTATPPVSKSKPSSSSATAKTAVAVDKGKGKRTAEEAEFDERNAREKKRAEAKAAADKRAAAEDDDEEDEEEEEDEEDEEDEVGEEDESDEEVRIVHHVFYLCLSRLSRFACVVLVNLSASPDADASIHGLLRTNFLFLPLPRCIISPSLLFVDIVSPLPTPPFG